MHSGQVQIDWWVRRGAPSGGPFIPGLSGRIASWPNGWALTTFSRLLHAWLLRSVSDCFGWSVAGPERTMEMRTARCPPQSRSSQAMRNRLPGMLKVGRISVEARWNPLVYISVTGQASTGFDPHPKRGNWSLEWNHRCAGDANDSCINNRGRPVVGWRHAGCMRPELRPCIPGPTRPDWTGAL